MIVFFTLVVLQWVGKGRKSAGMNSEQAAREGSAAPSQPAGSNVIYEAAISDSQSPVLPCST